MTSDLVLQERPDGVSSSKRNLTDSRLGNLGARAIYEAFDAYHAEFKAITRRARLHFESRDWTTMQRDAVARLKLYGITIERVAADIRVLLGERADNKLVWTGIKAVYSGLIASRDDLEIAETYFNSVTRQIFSTVGVDQQIEFLDSDFDAPPIASPQAAYFVSLASRSLAESIVLALAHYAFGIPYLNAWRDSGLAAKAIEGHLAASGLPPVDRLEFIDSVFFRGKAAYLIGRIWHGSGSSPLVIALSHEEAEIGVDAVLFTEDEVSILFSFARSYFHVETHRPFELVRFLQGIMPRKPVAEHYISIGYHKHGKTELYRHLLHHLDRTIDQFVVAPGTRGMVMLVFTLSSYDAVFKIIKDTFDEPKETTRAKVMEKYNLVFEHDRAGRLVDAQEFGHLEFDRSRFSVTLLAEMRTVAGETVTVTDEKVTIRHLYMERRVRPLNLYLKEKDGAPAEAAVLDYGQAIKDLAAANIFPGDILLKNFGITRHGRVVAYDYDELCLVTDCNFVSAPIASDFIEEYSAEPWFYVRDNDVFPKELMVWLELNEPLRSRFINRHGDMYGVAFWQNMQKRIRKGEVIDIFPYLESRRLPVIEKPHDRSAL